MQDEPGLTKYLANGNNMRVSTNPEEKDRVSQRKGSNHEVYNTSGREFFIWGKADELNRKEKIRKKIEKE